MIIDSVFNNCGVHRQTMRRLIGVRAGGTKRQNIYISGPRFGADIYVNNFINTMNDVKSAITSCLEINTINNTFLSYRIL